MNTHSHFRDLHYIVGVLTLYLHIPACQSLKDKRRVIKPLVSFLQRDFGISAAEIGMQDKWKDCFIACAFMSNDAEFTHAVLQKALMKVEDRFRQVNIIDFKIELI